MIQGYKIYLLFEILVLPSCLSKYQQCYFLINANGFYSEYEREEVWTKYDLYAQSERDDKPTLHVDLSWEFIIFLDKIKTLFML